MKRKLALLAVSLLVIAAGASYAPRTDALPGYETGTDYYDECLNETGWHLITCTGAHYDWGTTEGAKYKNEWRDGCDGQGYSSRWYEWDGTQWVSIPGWPGIAPGC